MLDASSLHYLETSGTGNLTCMRPRSVVPSRNRKTRPGQPRAINVIGAKGQPDFYIPLCCGCSEYLGQPATSVLVLLHHVFGPEVPGIVHFLDGGHAERADEAHAEELGAGVIPDALGKLGVHHFPGVLGAAAGGAAEVLWIIIPGAAAHRAGIEGGRFVPWRQARRRSEPGRRWRRSRRGRIGRGSTRRRCRGCRRGPRDWASSGRPVGSCRRCFRNTRRSRRVLQASSPKDQAVVVPARAAYSHSASVGRR